MKKSKDFFLKIIAFFSLYSNASVAEAPSKDLFIYPDPLQGGSGLQRVGSIPLPVSVQNTEFSPSSKSSQDNSNRFVMPQAVRDLKKFPYETTNISGRMIYLNGVNISSVRSQDLENVNIHIDKQGNIYIEAPHYETGVEKSYHPLMPRELPHFRKEEYREGHQLKGVYSKETGKQVLPLVSSPSDPSVLPASAPPVASQVEKQSAPPFENENNSFQKNR